VICPYSRGATITAVNMPDLIAGKGDKAIAWFRDDIGSDVPTPASLEGRIYVCSDKGLVSPLDAKTGETVWEVNLPQSRHAFSSSPLVAAGNLYITREDATTFVIGPLSAKEPHADCNQ
jgi:outer membrane protein assembly factor BamB